MPGIGSLTRLLLCSAVCLTVVFAARGAVASAADPPQPAATLANDPTLATLVNEALERRPELAQAHATVQADRARVPQARALPDPVLSLGIQNDGFRGIQIGQMETSWWSVTAAQTIPWFGKRGLRADALTLAARQSEADADRVRLSVQAEVERAYVDLLLVRDQLRLLSRLETLWSQAEGLSRTRYETGDAPQSDLLRSQLERSRLKQQRWALEAGERNQVAALNRSLGRPLDTPILTTLSLGDLQDPTLPDSVQAMADAVAQCPELAKVHLAAEQSASLAALARRSYFPDPTVSLGVMPRGGEFPPMWTAALSFTLPLWGRAKYSEAASESELRGTAARQGADAIQRLLLQRVRERRALLESLIQTNQLYRAGLLVQSDATVSSTMTQYQVGRVPFASVLEALVGYVADLGGFYQSIAAGQRIDIARREISLDPVTGPAAGGMSGSPVPGVGGMNGTVSSGAATTAPQPASATGSSGMPRM